MAKYWTYQELRTKVQRETDTEAEDFIQTDEMFGYINEAIDEAEKHIHTFSMEADYFLAAQMYDLTSGQQFLDLPTDVYAHKIRHISYESGDLIYTIKRFRGENLFETIANAEHYTNSGDYYKYILQNDGNDNTTPAPKIRLIPTSNRTETQVIRLWYIRNARRMEVDTDVMDIPEAAQFVVKYCVYKIFAKEGHPNAESAKVELEMERQSLMSTLETMTPDKDSTIVPDLTYYNDMT
jgi:hypothetical protein